MNYNYAKRIIAICLALFLTLNPVIGVFKAEKTFAKDVKPATEKVNSDINAETTLPEKALEGEEDVVDEIVPVVIATPKLSFKQVKWRTDIVITWNTVPNATSYQLFKYSTKTKKYYFFKNITSNIFVDSTTKAKKKYWYKVQAITNIEGYSDSNLSVAKSFTPKKITKIRLYMKCIKQLPPYPSGCEIASLASVMGYYKYDVSMKKLFYDYTRRQKSFYGKYDFNQAYLGTATSWNSFGGCYPKVIRDTANKYFESKTITTRKHIIFKGASPKSLYNQLSYGRPVIVWATMYMGSTTNFQAGKTKSGKKIYWHTGSHTLVLTGVDYKKKRVYFSDPLRGNVSYSKKLFEKRYKQRGKHAIVIY
ncbi:MAG: C39 family peptidase [Anaerovoracaceae bacterium]